MKKQITMYVTHFEVEETQLHISKDENFETTFEEILESAHDVESLRF